MTADGEGKIHDLLEKNRGLFVDGFIPASFEASLHILLTQEREKAVEEDRKKRKISDDEIQLFIKETKERGAKASIDDLERIRPVLPGPPMLRPWPH